MSEQFAAAPKVVKPKKKYKEKETEQAQQEEIKLIYNNLMWDKRIVRGNTYSAIVTSKNVDLPHSNTDMQKIRMQAKPQMDDTQDMSNRRANIEIFTDQYVQTLTDKPPKYEYAAQTDWKVQKPVIRYQMEPKIGTDIETQIWDNQLFDFDYECEPLLNVLCGRTLEISRMEVLQEEELRVMRDRQQELHLQQQAEDKKIRDMYDLEEKLQKENATRLQGFKRDRQSKKKTHRRLFSRVIAKKFLSQVKPHTLQIVQNNGFFRDPIQQRLVKEVLPYFYKESVSQVKNDSQTTKQAYDLVEEVRKTIIKEHAWAKEVEKTRRQKITDERNQQEREKRQRKLMKEEEKYMRGFLMDQKKQIQRLKEQQERKAAEEGREVQEKQETN